MSSIMSNILALHEKEIKKLKNLVTEYLDWLVEIDVKTECAELENTVFLITEEEYQHKLDELNNLCNELYSSILNINISGNSNIIQDTQDTQDNQDNQDNIDYILSNFESSGTFGTSIANLRNRH